MVHMDMFNPGFGNRKLQDCFYIIGLHCFAQIPGDNVSGIIIQNRQQVIPSSADDLEISEVCLPELICPLGGLIEVIFG
jgi:hypothetical protein